MAEDFELLGAPVEPEAIAKPAPFEVWIVNLPSFNAFWECQTQWRVAATMAGMVFAGLDYVACKLVLDDLNAAPGVFADLRIMESEAMNILNQVEAR